MDASNASLLSVATHEAVKGLSLAIVEARQVQIAPASEALRDWCARQIAEVKQFGVAGGDSRRDAVRHMLRVGGFRPAGRNKPAQEYLFRTMMEHGSLPAIFNVVDVLNLVSLASGLPISLLALERLGLQVTVRYGEATERFVFNRSGQELDLEGLLCVCRTRDSTTVPLGTPVKDSMVGKVVETDRHIAAFVFAPSSDVSFEELSRWASQLAQAFQEWCAAESTFVSVI